MAKKPTDNRLARIEDALRDLNKRQRQADANYAYMADVFIKTLDHLGLEVVNTPDGSPSITKKESA